MSRIRNSGPAQRNARSCRQSDGADDAQLIAHVLTRHPQWEEDFVRLMERHRGWIQQRCLRQLGNHHDAEDCVQEVLVRVYRGIQGFASRASFRSWLHSIVDNQCRTFATRRAKHVMSDHIKHLIKLCEESRSPQSEDAFGERVQVHRALADLPAHAREILHLRFFYDRSLEEIARLLNISLSAAKMRLYRALDQFKTLYRTSETRSPGAPVTAALRGTHK